MFHLSLPNNKPKRTLFFTSKFFMESSMKQASKHETTTFSSDQTPQESSWTMYFEDFFESSSSIVDVGEFSSSSVSDAMSFVATKKTLHLESSNSSNKFNTKRTRNREIPFGRHHDLEDTASSPSRSPNVRLALSPSLFVFVKHFN